MRRKNGRFLVVAGGICAAIAASAASAADFSWDGGSTTSNWTDPANWNPNVAPDNDNSASIHFRGTTRTSVNIDVAQSVNSVDFEVGSGVFTISGNQLTLGAFGIINNDDSTQTFTAPIALRLPQSWVSGKVNTTGNLTVSGAVNINTHSLTLDAMGNSTINISGGISGDGSLVKTGPGILSLTGTGINTYTGTTTVNAGLLALNSVNARALNGELIIGDGAGTDQDTVEVQRNQQLSLLPITIKSTGILHMGGFVDNLGPITLEGGTLNSTGPAAPFLAGIGNVTTLGSTKTATISANYSLGGNRTYTVNDGTVAVDLDISGRIAGPNTITKTGTGVMKLSGAGANTYTGVTTVNEGQLLLGKTGGAIAVAGSVVIGDGVGGAQSDVVKLELSSQIAPAATVTINSSGLLDLNNQTQEIAGLTLMGGDVTIGTGALRLAGDLTNNAATRMSTISGGALDMLGTARTVSVPDGPLAEDLLITSTISSGAMTKTGTGTLVIGGITANTQNAPTTVNAGVLILRKTAGGSAVAQSLVIGDASGTDIVRLDASNQIHDSAAVTVNSSGILQMGAFQDTIGSLTMTAGQITGDAASTLTLLGNVVTNAASTSPNITPRINLGGGVRTFTIADGSAVADLVLPATVSNGTVLKAGPGALRLPVANDISLVLSAGTVLLGHDQAMGTAAATINGGVLSAEGAARTIANNLTIAGDFATAGQSINFTGTATLGGNSRITVNNAQTTFSGVIAESATSNFTKDGPGTLVFSGAAANTYNNTTIVRQGTLQLAKTALNGAIPVGLVIGDVAGTGGSGAAIVRLAGPNQINDIAAVDVLSNGLFDLAGFNETIRELLLTGGDVATGAGTLRINGDITSNPGLIPTERTSVISGKVDLLGAERTITSHPKVTTTGLHISADISNGSIILDGGGDLELSGNNTISQLHLRNGTLRLASNAATGSGPLLATDGTIRAIGTRSIANNVSFNNLAIAGTGSLTLGGTVTGGTITKVDEGSLTFTDDVEASIILNSGTISAATLDVRPTKTFTQNGGTFSGTLALEGTFIHNGGTFAGHLLNEGTLTLNADFFPSNGITNRRPLQVSRLISVAGQGMLNEDVLTFAGGTLAGAGQIVNNALIEGFGSIGGTDGFINNGFFSQSGGNWILFNSGPNNNAGNMDLAAGRTFQLHSLATLGNTGTININGAIVSGGGTLSNSAGGTIAGRGTISSNLANLAGATLVAQGGTLNIPGGFTNAGTVQLTSGGTLGGGTINNTGRIQGAGNVSAGIVNTGTIEPVGGTLTLNGALTNSPAGTLTAPTGSELRITTGLSTNQGKITLNGGTFDKTGALTNASGGQIIGYGVFRTGGFTNDGSVLLSGGSATVEGNVTNNAGKLIHVQYTPAIFTGAVVNNGTFKNTATTITFAGSYTENGIFESDPADNFFSSVSISDNGAWVGGYGDRFFLSGDLVSSSRNRTGWQTAEAEIRFVGGVDHLLSVMGDDRGATFDGFEDNFAWRVLNLGASDRLILADVGEPGGALYVRELHLPGGINQISSIQSSGLNIYYHLGGANAYLGGQTYALSGGGSLAPVPEPSVLGLLGLGALSLLGRRRKHGTRGKGR